MILGARGKMIEYVGLYLPGSLDATSAKLRCNGGEIKALLEDIQVVLAPDLAF